MAKVVKAEVIKEKTACAALKHPIRVRILEVLCEGDISPVQFLHSGMLPPGVKFDSEQNAISHISYHFRVLLKADCIVLVNTKQRRGATEHIYRSKALAFHTDEEFKAMSFVERKAISRATLQTLIARADGAILAGTFDKRLDRHLSWLSMELDAEGWDELRDLQAETLNRAQGIKAAAIARKAEKAENPDQGVVFPATFGALAFESPPTRYTDPDQ
jgi:DNA-binding transcriptional ArsR family regulator